MEVQFVSRETIKSSSPDIHHRKPFYLSIFDQLFAPRNNIPIVLFYQVSGAHSGDNTDVSAQLKSSLSETLSTYYFLTGRVKENLYIDNYEEGVPFAETKVDVTLSDFLQNQKIELLNHFLPYTPFTYVSDLETRPLIAVQLNTFKCGGIALGLSFLHKAFDAASAGAFVKSWSVNCTSKSSNDDLTPDLLQASLRFPAIESSLRNHLLPRMDQIWSNERFRKVKRFVFYAKSIATLRQKARSELVGNPSRIETVSSFIWKSMSVAARKVSDSPRPSLSVFAVNIRQRATPSLPKDPFGNAVIYNVAAYNLADTDQMGLQDLVALTREAIANVNDDCINKYKSDKMLEAAAKYVDDLQDGMSLNPEMCFFSSWVHFGFNDMEFGWGKPLCSGVTGGGPAFTNAVIFKETGQNNEDLEVTIALEETRMAILEADPEFLAFATLCPSFLP